MPKEQINYPRTGEPITPGGSSYREPTEPEVSIHWNNSPDAGWVQIGIDLSISWIEDLIAATRKGSPNDSRITVYTDTLDRPTMQRLIKTARRSRDAVHGADE